MKCHQTGRILKWSEGNNWKTLKKNSGFDEVDDLMDLGHDQQNQLEG